MKETSLETIITSLMKTYSEQCSLEEHDGKLYHRFTTSENEDGLSKEERKNEYISIERILGTI